jgi:O-antigen/teichoic acid export membrane protein
MADVATKAVKHTTIYASGVIMARIASFIMLPIYTRFLTPADYGIIELLQMTLDFVAVVLGFQIGGAVFRHYMLYDDPKDKKEVISTALLLVVAANLTGILILGFAARPVAGLALGSVDRAGLLRLFSLSLVFGSAAETGFVFIRAEQRPWLFVGYSMLRLVLQLGLNIYFLVFRHLHVEGAVYSAVLSGGLMCGALGVYTWARVGLRWSWDKARELITFSWPLMLASIGAYYITFGDRFFLRAFATMAEVGIYSLGYRFAFLLVAVAWTPFTSIWDSEQYQVFKRSDARLVYGRTFVVASFLLTFASVGIAIFARDVLMVMSDAQFWPAAKVVPALLAAYVFQCWTGFANLGIMVARDTRQITIGTFVSVAVITVGYAALIPLFGGMGAAWATLAGMVARFAWIYEKARRHYDMELPWRVVAQLSALAGILYVASRLAPPSLLWAIPWHLTLVLAFPVLAIALPILPDADRVAALRMVRSPVMALKTLGLKKA